MGHQLGLQRLQRLFLGRLGRPLRGWGHLLLGFAGAATPVALQRKQHAGHAAELGRGRGGHGFQEFDDRREELLAFFDQLALTFEADVLPQETQSRGEDHLFAADAERETEASLVEQLKDLDDVLARVGQGQDGRRTDLLFTKTNRRSVDEGTDEVINQGLGSRQ